MSLEIFEPRESELPLEVATELDDYEAQITRYRRNEVDETKMQKLRLHFGTYAQRQEDVQMQRIKIPGGSLSSDQLTRLADAADRFGSSFIHFTTREDAQIYYVKLDGGPNLLRYLAAGDITTREACGNTVRNITSCYRAGTAADEAFDVLPYAHATFKFLVRNKWNQNLGRKFKIAFEGCSEDHSRLQIHDIGLWAVNQTQANLTSRGFRGYLGGGLWAPPHLAHLYAEFLPEAELLNLVSAALRLFDRYGERKARMKARMKFLIETMGWEQFRDALDEERRLVGPINVHDYFDEAESSGAVFPVDSQPQNKLTVLSAKFDDTNFHAWATDSVIPHINPAFRGVHVRIKLGDLTSTRARQLAEIARRYSSGQLRISIEQNIYLPWVRQEELTDLYSALCDVGLADRGVGTIADVTTCPGSDTCRLGIASAKGLGSALDEAFNSSMRKYVDSVGALKIKISGCPNGCAQHAIANIGFYSAALTYEDHVVPAHFVTVGGHAQGINTQFGLLLGKFPAKNCVRLTEALLSYFDSEKAAGESFNAFVGRVGIQRLKVITEPLQRIPSFHEDPSFFEDYGHEHERFAVRKGIKGECAGSTVAEKVPAIETAYEWLAQAEAYIYHKEFLSSVLAAYEAAAAAARVPLYQRLVDPFTADEALWEFDNLFVLSGDTEGLWSGVSTSFEQLRARGLETPEEGTARRILETATDFVNYNSLQWRKEARTVA